MTFSSSRGGIELDCWRRAAHREADQHAGIVPVGSGQDVRCPLDRRATRTVETGHGRKGEGGGEIASTDLVGYLDWPDHVQLFQMDRT